jgi:hypothetical protein
MIDVQRFECEGLKGAERLLTDDGDLIIELLFVELYAGHVLTGEIVAALGTRDCETRGIYSLTPGADSAPVQAGLLFSRNR